MKVFVPLMAVVVAVSISRRLSLKTKIKVALRSLLDFILVGPGVKGSFTHEYITQLENINQHVIGEVKENDKKEYFGWDIEILLIKPEAAKYVISKYENHVRRELQRMDEQRKEREEKNELPSDLEKGREVTEELFRKFVTLFDIYQSERKHKGRFNKALIFVVVLYVLIIVLSLFVYPSSVIPLKINLTSMLVLLSLLSIIAFIFSVLFILIYLL